ncbi:hypothetical protein N24_1206 [Corynebacterium suranareeae]|uniref:Uncharacterized protein n=1 Tax=Corynebacterium suranareeae TaxID=2506452 RepID=A0A161JNK8_9CORY|nr:hypothetical protein [Corynebacterium suranareeae]BAU95468.1 hypothetical protein N24_1206 [Corynebacterium suranareeae]
MPASSATPTQSYALEYVNRFALKSLITPEQHEGLIEAVIAPIESGAKLGVWVGHTFIGTVKDSAVLLNSQLLRIFASGYLISCQLHLTPARGTLASIVLPDLDFALIMNQPPQVESTLIPGGALWYAEPTASALFQCFLPKSTVLFELHEQQSVLSLLYNGIECAVLDIDDAAALSSAVQYCSRHGVRPMVHGRVFRVGTSVCIELDALPFEKWTKDQRRLGALRVPTLVPYQSDLNNYRSSVKQFSEAISEQPTQARPWTPTADKIVAYSPHAALVAGGASLAAVLPASNFAPNYWIAYSITGAVLLLTAVVVLFARRRGGNTQFWNLLSSVGLMASVPVFVFITANTYIDATSTSVVSAKSTPLTTLSSRPVDATSGPSDLDLANAMPSSVQSPNQVMVPLAAPQNHDAVSPAPQGSTVISSPSVPGESPSYSDWYQETTTSELHIGTNDPSREEESKTSQTSTSMQPPLALPPTFAEIEDEPVETTTSEEPTELPEQTETPETTQPPTATPYTEMITTSEAPASSTEASVDTTEASLN